MQKNPISVPVLKLPTFILPEGLLRLRIIEASHLRLIKIAIKQTGFIIALDDGRKQSKGAKKRWGSLVNIVNFDQSDDGILEVDVKCSSIVNITSSTLKEDKLCYATFEVLPNWSEEAGFEGQKKEPALTSLSNSLLDVFDNNQILNELYVEKKLDNAYWVIARWLELLPIANETKSVVVLDYNFEQAKSFVHSIIHTVN